MGSDVAKPFNQKHADEILEIIASSNKSLHTILSSNPEYPKLTTFYKWLDDNEVFAKNYARAKDCQADYLAEEILEISDDGTKDNLETDFGVIENKEWVNRSKLRVDSRKWIASKLKPKKYGDRLELDGKVDSKTKVVRVIMGQRTENITKEDD